MYKVRLLVSFPSCALVILVAAYFQLKQFKSREKLEQDVFICYKNNITVIINRLGEQTFHKNRLVFKKQFIFIIVKVLYDSKYLSVCLYETAVNANFSVDIQDT